VVYIFIVITALLVSIISPPFRIAKLFTSVRESGTIQNYQDSFQFPKICLKRYVLISVFSYLIPAVILVLGLQYFINILASVFILNNGISTTGWDISLGILLWLLLTVSILFSSIEDVKTTSFYETLMQKFVNPPPLKWINQGYNLNASGRPVEMVNFNADSSLSLDSKKELCSTCSEPLVDGAEFCTHCGKKIVE
ncbi:MAG: zinc ribbon domain-containing protein, partial [Candidatus Heimdallarchaeota archaeon]|nr:zinc ribbon domain-containing protein [Candidatus Heimdallarchaeota archaeon]